MVKSLFFVFLLPLLLISEEPWGPDADLSIPREQASLCCHPPPQRSIFVKVGEKMIRFHQEVISPADGPRSHFIPSSSEYTLNAMRKYGFFIGFSMGCDRLMRENNDPWVYQKITAPDGKVLKWNPVP
jgi:uncharacterized protein